MTPTYHWRQSVAVEEARIAYDIARDAQIHAERSGTYKDSDTMWQLTRASYDAFDALCNTVVSALDAETPR